MRFSLFFCIVIVTSALTQSCNGNGGSDLQQKVDSLQTALQNRDADYGQLNEFLTIISAGLDSIEMQESDIFDANHESPLPNREQMKNSLSQFRETLKNQREKIAELEKKLATEGGNNAKLQKIVKALRAQLEEKDAKIAELEQRLDEHKISLENLKSQYNVLSQQSEIQLQTIAEQTETLQQQDMSINEGFIRMGTKQELKADGLLQGGFLKKSKVNFTNVDANLFQAVDIRQATEIDIPSKSPKLLTPVPAGSYELKPNGSSTILIVTDPAKFWSVSKYLIIQTK